MSSSRRDFVKAAMAGLPLSAALLRAAETNQSNIAGVQLGVQTYSFHDILNDSQNHADEIVKKVRGE